MKWKGFRVRLQCLEACKVFCQWLLLFRLVKRVYGRWVYNNLKEDCICICIMERAQTSRYWGEECVHEPVIPGPNAGPSLTASEVLVTALSTSTCEHAETQTTIWSKWYADELKGNFTHNGNKNDDTSTAIDSRSLEPSLTQNWFSLDCRCTFTVSLPWATRTNCRSCPI